MNELSTFNFNMYPVRVINIDSEPWFVAKDIADILEYSDSRVMTRRLDDDEKGVQILHTLGGDQEMTVINESGLYNAILGSNKPEAKTFKKWITSEVLPSIRKHGAYATPATLENMVRNPDFAISLFQELKKEQDARKILEAKAEADKPRIVFAESIEVSHTSVLVGEMAKLIKQSTGADIGQNRFFDFLRENGYVHSSGEQRNLPTQRSIDSGWMEIKEGSRFDNNGVSFITRTPKITGKGQVYFVNLFKKQQVSA